MAALISIRNRNSIALARILYECTTPITPRFRPYQPSLDLFTVDDPRFTVHRSSPRARPPSDRFS